MVKKPLGDEMVVGRLQPGASIPSDVSVSRESIFRARRVLHRAIVVLRVVERHHGQQQQQQPGSGDGGDDGGPRWSGGWDNHGRLLQALGLVGALPNQHFNLAHLWIEDTLPISYFAQTT